MVKKRLLLFLFIIYFISFKPASVYSSKGIDLLNKLKENPLNYKLQKDVGLFYFEKSDYYNAVEFLNNSLDLNVNDFDIYKYLYKSYLNLNRPADAEFILKQGLNYFPELQGYYNKGIEYTFKVWVNSNYFHNRYKSDVWAIARNELSTATLFDFHTLRHNYNNFESVSLLNESLKNFYFYRELSLSEIVGHSILSDILIRYNIRNINFDLLNVLKNYLSDNTEIVNVMYYRYYGYKEPRRVRQFDSEHSFRQNFSPLLIKVRVPFVDEIFVNNTFNNAINNVVLNRYNFIDAITYLRNVYDKVYQNEYKRKLESFVFYYVSESFKNIRREYLHQYLNLFIEKFPEHKFKVFLNSLVIEDERIYDVPPPENMYHFVSDKNNFEYLSLNNLKVDSLNMQNFIDNNFIVQTKLNVFYSRYNFQDEEYFISLPDFSFNNERVDLISELEPFRFYRSISKYYRERNEIIDWRLHIVYNIKSVEYQNNKYNIILDIFYAKLYNSRLDIVIQEWFNLDELNIDDFNIDKNEIKKYLLFIE